LLLDEPSTGLDPAARVGLRLALDELRAASGVTIVVTTHLLDEAERCDRVAVLHRGRLVACEAPSTLRAGLGTDVALVAGEDLAALAAKVATDLGWPAEVRGEKLRVEVPTGDSGASRLVNALAGAAHTITVGRPTLEDVFLKLTGESWGAVEES
jgi:ABC-2 type transport system ATP-binding protein